MRVAMCSTERLGDDGIDNFQLSEIATRELQTLGELSRALVAFEKNRGACFWRYDRVPGELHHRHAVGYADAQCAARSAFAGHDADDWCSQPRHFHEVSRNRLGLPTFLGSDSRVRAGGVNQRHDRQAELLGKLHASQRLAIPLGICQTE